MYTLKDFRKFVCQNIDEEITINVVKYHGWDGIGDDQYECVYSTCYVEINGEFEEDIWDSNLYEDTQENNKLVDKETKKFVTKLKGWLKEFNKDIELKISETNI